MGALQRSGTVRTPPLDDRMRNDHSRPFDLEAHEADDVTTQFWGATRDWEPRPEGEEPPAWSERATGVRSRRTGSLPRTSGSRDRTRTHGIPRPDRIEIEPAPPVNARREATLGELAAGWIDDEDDDWGLPTQQVAVTPQRDRRTDRDVVEYDEFDDRPIVPLSPIAPLVERLGLGAVDPLLARLGAIVMIGVLLVPVALALRSGNSDSLVTAEALGAPVAATQSASDATSVAAPATAATQAPQAAASQTVATAAAESYTAAPAATPATEAIATNAPTGTEAPASSPVTTAAIEAATADVPAERVEPVCALTYEAGPGDSWYRIAEEAGITPGDLIATNLATLDTPIFPGDEICLPPGAQMPSPPTTAPATTAAPATTQPASTVAPTTAAPTTTKPPASASTAQVQQLIRDIWPDDLEEKALQIAWRESNYKANAYNGTCCYGVFQLHWSSHKSWLDDYGILTSSDLYDARKNITAAYALYQRSGGWGPWGG